MKVLAWIFIILLITAAVGLYLLNSAYNDLLEPVSPEAVDSFSFVEIPQGANTETIADILYDEELIQNQLAFRFYVRRYDLGQGFIAGRYRFSPSMSLEQIVLKIQSGDVYTETSWFTIPEGFSIDAIAERLEQDGLVNGERFLDLARQPSQELIDSFPFLADVTDSRITYVLEGYLFPDTYEVFTDAGEEAIIRVMLNRLVQIINEEEQARINAMGMTLHEVLTLASIVEREARVDHERPLIAGVFYNRLQIGQRLESCATIQYILGETKEFLTFADLELPSPYNTYQNAGLPPGPIAASGEASIMATLYPEESDYYFFNYKYDDSGEHYFSKTLEEHNQNVAKAEENLN
jgi:UPF0755 protein